MQREEQGNPTDNPELLSVRKLKRSTESLVGKEEPELKVDLRIEGSCACGDLGNGGELGKFEKWCGVDVWLPREIYSGRFRKARKVNEV